MPTATDAGESVPTTSPIGTADETAAATVTIDDAFPDEVDQLLEGRSGQYLVVVIGPNGEPEYRLNDDVQVQAASLYKLLIMVEVLKQVEDGRLELDRPVRLEPGFFVEAGFDDPFDDSYIGSDVNVDDLLLPMVAYSSNVAAYALLDLVGNTNINATAAELGLTASEIRWMPTHRSDHVSDAARYAQVPPETPSAEDAFNVTSAADMALLFQLMVDGDLVSPGASERMLEILTAQVVNNRLPALLPPDTDVAHKTGNIDNVVHDAGVIFTPSGLAVVVVLTADALEWEAIEFMQELALLVYELGAG